MFLKEINRKFTACGAFSYRIQVSLRPSDTDKPIVEATESRVPVSPGTRDATE